MTGNNDPFLVCREWAVLRMRALERDGAKCVVCARTAHDGVRINVDHIKPRGRNPELALTLSNLQVMCHECNRGKGNKFDTNWRAPRQPTGPLSAEEKERARQLDLVRERLERPA